MGRTIGQEGSGTPKKKDAHAEKVDYGCSKQVALQNRNVHSQELTNYTKQSSDAINHNLLSLLYFE